MHVKISFLNIFFYFLFNWLFTVIFYSLFRFNCDLLFFAANIFFANLFSFFIIFLIHIILIIVFRSYIIKYNLGVLFILVSFIYQLSFTYYRESPILNYFFGRISKRYILEDLYISIIPILIFGFFSFVLMRHQNMVVNEH
jgi:hypothetical protein